MLGDVHKNSVSPVFIGRAEELGILTDALARAAGGEPQALLIGGEAGVGKTRLIEEFLTAATGAGAVTAVGGCVEIGCEGLPFAPVSTALRALHRQLGGELALAAAGQEGELARLLPELGETTRESHDEDGRARLFELTARMLERLTAERTLVLVVEDLHWADRSTRELLAYLLRSLHTGRLVIIASYRSDDIHRRHPLRPFLAELDRMRSLVRIELSRFTRAEVGAQLTGISGSVPDDALLDRVFARSDGNAFFVEELATAIAEGCTSGLSTSLRDLLLVRVEALAEDTQQVVRFAAEGGLAVEYQLLRAVCGLGEDELIAALRQAVGAGILLPALDGDGYRFRHALVREAVTDDLLPGERSRLNRRYAQALEAEPALLRADELAARLATYWYHAHEPVKALPAVLAASVRARRRYAYAEQLRLLERALELWEDVPAEERDRQRPFDAADAYPACGCADEALSLLDLLAEMVTAAIMSGERERALAVCKKALKMLDETKDPLRAAWFWTQRSKLMEGLVRTDGSAEIIRAQELVRGLPPSPVHAEVIGQAAAWSAVHTPGPDSYQLAERAVELARLVGAEGTGLNARLTLAGLRIDSGDVEGGLAEMRAVRARVVELGYVPVIGRCHVNLSSALEGVGRSAEAVAVVDGALALLDRYGLRDSKAWALSNKAKSLLSLGRWTEVEQVVPEVLRLAQGRKPSGFGAHSLARLALARGDLAQAERQLAAVREHHGVEDPQPQIVIPLAHTTLELAAARGQLADARTALTGILDAGLPPGTQRSGWPLLIAAAGAEADARGLPAAEPGRAEILARIRTAAKKLPRIVPLWQAYGAFLDAELLRAEGQWEPDRWAETVAAFELTDRPYDLARVRHRWAEALLTTGGAGGVERAAELLPEVHATAVRLGARPLREAAELLARRARLPLTPPQRPTAAAGSGAEALGLTPRERDVLRLVAQGRSNRQIAEELFISPKTASVHVSNILAKLGASGRGEAAATAYRLRLFSPAEGV
ncbi:helix-turn-helix transcriptional regulator [Streptomyces orinoci]|uniref:helix-turn-helix transcriptional regulator n=1 Tax=Streptomyces orinoci TaxID=67339 RepID=UPI003BAACFF6